MDRRVVGGVELQNLFVFERDQTRAGTYLPLSGWPGDCTYLRRIHRGVLAADPVMRSAGAGRAAPTERPVFTMGDNSVEAMDFLLFLYAGSEDALAMQSAKTD